ncbi:MAG: isoprenylcysteine carboxylmethyltransferase family protein [Candidatus Dormiibacterota bacterium]
MRRWYPVLVAALAIQRGRELQLSRRLERANPGPRAAAGTFPLMVTAHLALFVLPPLEVKLTHRRARHPGVWLGVLAAATGLRWWSIRSLGPQWNVRAAVPPDLDPVATGPYRWVRHPNYLAVMLEFMALPMAGGAMISALGLSILDGAVLLDRIRSEEALLFEAPGYAEAFAGKARFIPGIF